MQIIKISSVLLVIISIMIIGCVTPYRPSIPKDNIPPTIPDDVKNQVERLYSSSAIERASAANRLMQLKSQAIPAIPFLVGILGDCTELVWVPSKIKTSPGREAAFALSRGIGEPAMKPLIDAWENETYKTSCFKRNTLFALTDLLRKRESIDAKHFPRAVEPLIVALEENDFDVRIGAAFALGEIGDPRAVEPLIQALKDKDPFVRDQAARALGKLKDPRAVEPLIRALRTTHTAAAEALGEMRDPRAVEPLMMNLHSGYYPITKASIEALRKMGIIIGGLKGIIEKVDEMAKALDVKGRVNEEEKTMTFATTADTKITGVKIPRGEDTLSLADLKKGMPVWVDYKIEGEKMIAIRIQRQSFQIRNKKR